MNDDILCEAPGPNGMVCTLPYGHKGNQHAYEIQLPPHVAKMIEGYISELENQTKRVRKAKNFMYVAAGLNIVGVIWTLASILVR